MNPPTPAAPETPSRGRAAIVKRVLLALLVAASLSLCWWSLKRLMPLQAENRTLSTDVARLGSEVDKLEALVTRKEQEHWSNKVQTVESLLFPDQQAIADWLEAVKETMTPLSLEAEARFGTAKPRTVAGQKLTVIPLTIDVHPTLQTGGRASVYQRLLELLDQLANGSQRADFTELTVSGSSNSVGRATAVLELWMKGEGS